MTGPVPFDELGGHGPLLHFAHANGFPPGSYRQFLQPLTARYRVVAIRQRPLWSGTSAADFHSWHLLGEDLVRLFDQQGWRQVVGIGHSLGGVAMLVAARRRPELFRVLVMAEPVFLPPAILDQVRAQPEATAFLPLVQGALNRRTSWPSRQAAFDRFRHKALFRRWSDAALWDYVNSATRHDPERGRVVLVYPREWEARIYALPPTDVWELVAGLTHPTLALRGADSDTIQPAAWQTWQQRQPDATFVEVPEAGHMLTMERPAHVAGLIMDYLDSRMPPPPSAAGEGPL